MVRHASCCSLLLKKPGRNQNTVAAMLASAGCHPGAVTNNEGELLACIPNSRQWLLSPLFCCAPGHTPHPTKKQKKWLPQARGGVAKRCSKRVQTGRNGARRRPRWSE